MALDADGAAADEAPPQHHILSVLVENKAGVLSRVASLFSRRGYNIFSLAVAPSDDPRLSRITIVVDVASSPLEQVVKQLDKLIPVVRIAELAPADAVERELLLATVQVAPEQRGALAELVGELGALVVDDGPDRLTVSLADRPGRIDELEERLRPYGILDIQRTGRVALPRIQPAPGLHAVPPPGRPDPTDPDPTSTKAG